MNDIDEMQEDMLRVVRDSLSKMPMSDPPCVEAIVAPARDRRRRRHALISAAGAAVAAVLVLVTVGALSVRNDTPRSATDTATTRSTSDSPRSTLAPVRLTAVSFVANSDGTTTLTLSNDQLLSDPPALRTYLAQHNIPALVTTGTFCTTPSSEHVADVLSRTQSPASAGVVQKLDVTINPAAIPTGHELSIGIAQDPIPHAKIGFVDKNNYTCTTISPSDVQTNHTYHVLGGKTPPQP